MANNISAVQDEGITEKMARCLEHGLSELCGNSTKVIELRREPFKGSSSFATEYLTALLENDVTIEIFFKDLNPANQLDEARNIRTEIGLKKSAGTAHVSAGPATSALGHANTVCLSVGSG